VPAPVVHDVRSAALDGAATAAVEAASTAKTPAAASDGAPSTAGTVAPRATSFAGATTIVPIALPTPPPSTSALGSTFASALLAISEAEQIDPQAAQNASFAYVQAAQQYRAGNFTAARVTLLSAFATASAAQVRVLAPTPLPTPALVSTPPQLPGTAGGLYGGDAPAIDAASFIALARGTIDDCTARHDRRLSTAQSHFAAAQADFAARNWEATRADAKAAIDACRDIQPE